MLIIIHNTWVFHKSKLLSFLIVFQIFHHSILADYHLSPTIHSVTFDFVETNDHSSGFNAVESNTFVILKNLKPYTSYSIKVRAYTPGGASPYSVTVTARTLEDGKCTYYVLVGWVRFTFGLQELLLCYVLVISADLKYLEVLDWNSVRTGLS